MKASGQKMRLKFTLEKIGSGKTPLGGAQAYVPTGVMLLRSQNVHFDGLHVENVVFIDEETDAEMASTRVQSNDVLLNITGASLGRCTVVPDNAPKANVNQHVCILRPNSARVLPRFLNVAMQSLPVQNQIFAGENGSSREGLTFEQIGNLELVLPELNEQRSIAGFLDRETARLDALVEEKERVLELLAEKRRALITHAVTLGLNPAAPICDSGLPWLGQIPAHWETWKLNHFARVGNGSTPKRENADYWNNGSIPWLNSSVVNQGEVKDADQFVTETALRECHLPMVSVGSVLVGITGQGKTRGLAVVVSIKATINQHLAFVTPDPRRAESWYLRWLFFAKYDFLRAISDDAGGTKGALTCEQLAEMRVALPPLAEQRAIVAHIALEAAKLDKLRASAERTIALLKERRAALIAAAVTGKITVQPTRKSGKRKAENEN